MTQNRRGFINANPKWIRPAVAAALFLLVALLAGAALAGCGAGPESSSSLVPPQTALEASSVAPPQVALKETLKRTEKINDTQNDTINQTGQNKSAPAEVYEQTAPPGSVKVTPAVVTIVVDGDTVYASLNGREEKVRFIGVDTPESTREVEPYGKEAPAYTQQRLAGRQVYLELDVGERDKYGRLLAYVWLEKPVNDSEAEVRAKMYNAELLLNGYAQVMTVPPNVKYADLFVKLQREAREAGKGLWGAAVTAPAPAPASGGKSGSAAKYIGNSSSKKFYYPDCQWAKEISLRNKGRVQFTTGGGNAGYMPCKV
ncbi:hypothetical protein MHLNE_03530 [Moorella humiferrea]|uniref:thermonuclease family protein n=1 Tax=Neomoorella humiferrea TaxID=676965 RepID=UPI0030D11BB0